LRANHKRKRAQWTHPHTYLLGIFIYHCALILPQA